MNATALQRGRATPSLHGMAKRRPPPTTVEPGFIEALRRHGQVIDADSCDVPLPEGVTHIIVHGKLIERRKSAF